MFREGMRGVEGLFCPLVASRREGFCVCLEGLRAAGLALERGRLTLVREAGRGSARARLACAAPGPDGAGHAGRRVCVGGGEGGVKGGQNRGDARATELLPSCYRASTELQRAHRS